MTADLPLRGEIYDKLKFCAVNNIPRKITNILEVLKLEAQVPDFLPEQDRIHLSNGKDRHIDLKNHSIAHIGFQKYYALRLRRLSLDMID